MPPLEENSDLPYFTPKIAHLLLKGVYGDYLHHNDGSHLDGGVADNAISQRCWCRVAAQLDRWYTTPYGAVGSRFMTILAAEWWGVLRRTYNSNRPLFFAHVALDKTLGVCRAREIWAQNTRHMEL